MIKSFEAVPKPIVAEEDSVTGSYCIHCFSAPKNVRNKLYFYNSEGPFCSKTCYSEYLGIESPRDLPTIEWKGRLR